VGAPQRRRIAPGLPDARCVIQSTASTCATSQAAAVRRIRLGPRTGAGPPAGRSTSFDTLLSRWIKSA